MTAIPREKVARIVEDLARCTRTISAIAERHHVSTEIVFQLREQFGPGPVELAAAAQELRRPALPPKPAEPAADPASPASPEQVAELVAEVCKDGLTGPERRACRAWAGLPVSSRNVPRAALALWTAAGRPMPEVPAVAADVPDAEPDAPDVADAEPTPPSRELDWRIQRDARARFIADVAEVEAALAARQAVRVPDAEARWIAATTAALDAEDAQAEAAPQPDAPTEAGELDRLLAECLTIPALAMEYQAVADAVEMLRDARAEHEHRERLIEDVRDSIRHHGLHLTPDQLRVILDAYEAAA